MTHPLKGRKIFVRDFSYFLLLEVELDPARMTLLAGFFETYLRLNESEERRFEEEMGKVDEKEARKMIELTTSWEEKGRTEGQAELLLKQLRKKFSVIPADMENQIRSLPGDRLEQLAEAIFDLKSIDDVQAFLK